MGASEKTPAHQAELLRQSGKIRFKKDRFSAAIEEYTGAIALCPDIPVYYTNRALCHLKRNDWVGAKKDSRSAIELDNTSVKAHYILGRALLEENEFVQAVRELEKAFDLEKGANPNGDMVEEIRQELVKAKGLELENASAQRSRELRHLKEACVCALNEKHSRDVSQMDIDNAEAQHLQQLNALERVFTEAAEAIKVPDYLCCPITFDILRDPVITPCGHTYERAAILKHLQTSPRQFDPTTRMPLHSSQLKPNMAIKKAVQAFLDKQAMK